MEPVWKLNHPQIRSLAIIAEGIPERQSRMLLKAAEQRKVTVIGPALVVSKQAVSVLVIVEE